MLTMYNPCNSVGETVRNKKRVSFRVGKNVAHIMCLGNKFEHNATPLRFIHKPETFYFPFFTLRHSEPARKFSRKHEDFFFDEEDCRCPHLVISQTFRREKDKEKIERKEDGKLCM